MKWSADFGSKFRTAQNELENEPYMLGKLQMSIFWSISRIVNIIFLEEVMAILTLKGSQEAEQFVTDKKALKAINPIKLTAKTNAAKNKPANTYSNIRGNEKLSESNGHKGCPKSYNCFSISSHLLSSLNGC
ncbi:hypothetical protein D8674_034882 [Pyrus ussuriensis x Pyrus communis]|uniref:Uncharacterized protein n=1 Tax=Pyrus ussuriensis x Pyrus communis TaxID=2448454 RepID=A0A5N5GAX9_9ROSA|nr:hypothetical protein D8674_034882 [Pyrus ussuriensis x Pyrus communis]